MSKKTEKKMTKAEMDKELFVAIKLLGEQKGIPAEYMYEKINEAIVTAIKKTYQNRDIVVCEINPEKQSVRVYLKKNVVSEIQDEITDLTLEEARAYDENAVVGSVVEIPVNTEQLGRIVTQNAKSIIRQAIREAEKEVKKKEIDSRQHEMVTAKVIMISPESGDAKIEIGKVEVFLNKSEMLPGDNFKPGDLVKVYIPVATDDEKKMIYSSISRRHPELVKKLFESEVPEVKDGIVEIVNVSREAGSRTKISVKSKDENVDAVGTCIGPRGSRVANVVDALCGEKIDVIKYSDDPAEHISGALAPATVISVIVSPDGAKTCTAVVPDNQLSLAIGNKGQNVRLAARLTGWKIDIKSQSQMNS